MASDCGRLGLVCSKKRPITSFRDADSRVHTCMVATLFNAPPDSEKSCRVHFVPPISPARIIVRVLSGSSRVPSPGILHDCGLFEEVSKKNHNRHTYCRFASQAEQLESI